MTPENKALIERELGPFVQDPRGTKPPLGMVHIAEVALDRLLTAARGEGRAETTGRRECGICLSPAARAARGGMLFEACWPVSYEEMKL